MGAWGTGLYSADFAADLRATIAAVSRLPLDEDALVRAISGAETSAAENAADQDHTVFWLILADQFEKRGIFSPRVRDTALAIIDGGQDAATMQRLGMKAADLRKRAANLTALRQRIVAQPAASKPRKTMDAPQPYCFEVGGVYAYPTLAGDTINPYMSPKYFNRAEWSPDGFGLLLVIERGRAFDYLPWYEAVTALEVVASIPDRTRLVGDVRWGRPFHGTMSAAHFRKMEITEIGVFALAPSRVDHFYPHRWPGTIYAIQDISMADDMRIKGLDPRTRRWRQPDGKLVPIVFPDPPTIAELMGSVA